MSGMSTVMLLFALVSFLRSPSCSSVNTSLNFLLRNVLQSPPMDQMQE